MLIYRRFFFKTEDLTNHAVGCKINSSLFLALNCRFFLRNCAEKIESKEIKQKISRH